MRVACPSRLSGEISFGYGVIVHRITGELELALAPTLQALGGEAREDLTAIASMGFRAVQLSATQPGLRPRELDGSARRGLRATLRRLELQPAGVDLWIPGEHFTLGEHVDRAVDAVCAAIELAANLAATIPKGVPSRVPVSLTLPNALPADVADSKYGSSTSASSTSSATGDAIAAIATIAGHAERFGVELADHAVPIVDGVGRNIGWGVDPAAWLAHGEDPAQIIAAHSARHPLVSARLVDLLRSGMRGPPGIGPEHRLDILAYRVALSIAGYRRPVVLDARQWTDVHGGLHAAASQWNALASALP